MPRIYCDAMTLLSRLRHFLHDHSGASALTFALCMVPILGFFALAIDYGYAMSFRQQLDAAADAASLQTINTARAQILANPAQSTATTQLLAEAAGVSAFKANAGADISALTNNGLSVTLLITDPSPLTLTLTATASYSATANTSFAKLFGTQFSTFGFSGTSKSSTTMANYIGYYLLVDVSGSMGTPSTISGQSALAAINPDDLSQYQQGCIFACHFSGYQGYAYSRTNSTSSTATPVANNYCPQPDMTTCIQLRIDAVATALKAFMSSAQTAQSYDNQIAVGLYPFIVNQFQYFPQANTGLTLSTDLSTASSMAGCIPGLVDNGGVKNSASTTCPASTSANVTMGSGGTHIGNAFSQLSQVIPQPIGDGSSEDKRKPVVFLITDGAEDEQTYSVSANFDGKNHATTIAQKYCALFSGANIPLYILNIPYITIQPQYFNASFAGDEDGYANSNIPYIAPSLQSCVTTQSNYFVADPYNPSSITDQIQAMFAQSLLATRLIQ